MKSNSMALIFVTILTITSAQLLGASQFPQAQAIKCQPQPVIGPQPIISPLPEPILKPLPLPYPGVCQPEQQQCCDDQTLNVFGSATIQVAPDRAEITASFQVNGRTVVQAIQGLAQRINAILAILKQNNIPREDYETTSVNVFPNTTWNNGKSEIIGQIASQSLRIVIVNIGNDGQRISRLIDALATVNGIQINGISYDLADKTKAFAQARQAAYKNAQDKARDLTDALAISLGRLIKLTDFSSVAPVVSKVDFAGAAARAEIRAEAPVATEISVDTIPIFYSVDAVYEFS